MINLVLSLTLLEAPGQTDWLRDSAGDLMMLMTSPRKSLHFFETMLSYGRVSNGHIFFVKMPRFDIFEGLGYSVTFRNDSNIV